MLQRTHCTRAEVSAKGVCFSPSCVFEEPITTLILFCLFNLLEFLLHHTRSFKLKLDITSHCNYKCFTQVKRNGVISGVLSFRRLLSESSKLCERFSKEQLHGYASFWH